MEQSRSKRGDPHGWNALPNYLNVHESHLDALREYFTVADDLTYDFSRLDRVEIQGRIRCEHDLFVDVDKVLERNERRQVRTVRYSYHAGVEGPRDRPIFRYDNAHTYLREGHKDEHHKHRFDPATWQEIKPPEWIGRDHWPHLRDVIEELHHWWQTTGQYLNLATAP